MNVRRILVAPLVLALLGLAACSGSGPGAGGAAGGGSGGDDRERVQVLVWGSPDEIKGYRALVDAFEASQPDVRIQLITAADRQDLLTRLSTGFSGGNPPDLFLLNYRFVGQYTSKGVLEPLGTRMATSTAIPAEAFYAPALDAFRANGEITCLPQNISSLVVYVNEDLFAQAGVALPEAGWTWDEMVDAAKKLTADRDGDGTVDVFGLGVEPSIIRVAPFVWSNGGEIVDDPARPTRLALESPEASEALQEFLDLYRVDKVIPSELEFEAEDNETRFANGRMAMVLQSRRSTPMFRTITAFDWDVAPLPVFDRPANVLHSDGYCLTKASPRKDAAWRFLEFALGPDGAPVTASSGRTVPSLRSVAESPAFLDPGAEPASSKVFLDAIPSIRALPAVSTWPEIEDEAALIIEVALWRETKSAADVARELDEMSRPIFARAEGG